MSKPPDNWPNGTLPRGLSINAAAYYIGVSINTFRRMVDSGMMPRPKEFGARKIWDRYELDAALDRKSKPVNSYDKIMEAMR